MADAPLPVALPMTGNRSYSVVALTTVMMIVITFFIVFRLWARLVVIQGSYIKSFWWDDVFCFAAWVFAMATYAVTLSWVHFGGFGKHIWTIPPDQLVTGLKLLYAGQILENFSLVTARISVLFFYLRVWAGTSIKVMLYSIYVSMGLSIAYWISFVVTGIVACHPIEKSWKPLMPGTCLKTSKYWFWFALLSVIIDLLILIVPLPMIWQLQMKPRRKISIVLLFLSGYCVLATALGRTIAIHIDEKELANDPTYGAVPVVYWFILEPTLAVVSISLPAIFSLFKLGYNNGFQSIFSTKSVTSSYRPHGSKSGYDSSNNKNHKASQDDHFERLNDSQNDLNPRDYVAMVGMGSEQGDNNVKGIQVRKDYNIS